MRIRFRMTTYIELRQTKQQQTKNPPEMPFDEFIAENKIN